MGWYYIDWTYIVLVLPAVLFAMWASAHVNSVYKKYSGISASNRITGAEAARRVLESNGVHGVRITGISGKMTDNFNPENKVISLSEGVYNSTSVAAIGIACHEAGHAVQHDKGYAPARIRSAMVPVTNLGSRLAVPLIMIGLILCYFSAKLIVVAYVGVALFSLATLFQLVTLPTEFNASRRAFFAIENMSLDQSEVKGAKKVLKAAALTYVAALAVSLTQLLRLLIIVMGRSRRD